MADSFITLMYHDIIRREDFSEEQRGSIRVADGYEDRLPAVLFSYLDDFLQHMKYLKEDGWHTLTMGEIRDFYEKGAPLPEKAVHLTFDDLYKSVYLHALPLFKEYGFHATAFCVKGWVFDEEQPYDPLHPTTMSKGELVELRRVFEIANHTTSLHERVAEATTSLITNAKEEIIGDLRNCDSMVDNTDFFAYPFGIYDGKSVEILKEAGFSYAYTSDPGINRRDTNPLELYRCFAPLGTDRDAFIEILNRK